MAVAAFLNQVKDRVSVATQTACNKVAAVVDTAQAARVAALQRALSLRDFALATYTDAKRKGIRTWSLEISRLAGEVTSVKIGELRDASKEALAATKHFASKKSVQTTAASAVGGAMTMGAGGAVTGAAAGSMVGATMGLPLALFTFGLSIPFGAALGGGAGLVVGATTGASAGAVGAGAAGYGAYQHRGEIRSAANKVTTKASSGVEFVKGRASSSAEFVKGTAQKSAHWTKDVASATRARVMRASTGSSD